MYAEGNETDIKVRRCSKEDCKFRCAHSLYCFGILQLLIAGLLIWYNYYQLWVIDTDPIY